MNPEDPGELDTEESDSEHLTRSRLGRKPQVGGGLAVFIGILLLVFFPSAQPGTPDIHKMALIFIGIGIFLIAAGTYARWSSLD